MAIDTFRAQVFVLEELRALVQDHGDVFRWSISKASRVWLTLTHWDTYQYNTSVEVDPTSDVADILGALTVLCIAHKGKCFGDVVKSDSWKNTADTKALIPDAINLLLAAHTPTPEESDSAPKAPPKRGK